MSGNFTAKIIELMPPPPDPPETDVNWVAAGEVMGVGYPEDFKEFIAAYGSLVWCDTFRTVYPGVDRAGCGDYKTHIMELLDPLDYLYDENEVFDFKRYPERGGLLPCMIDFNGKTVCWITDGEPDEWGILVWMRGPCRIFPGYSMTRLIFEWINQTDAARDVWRSELLEPDQFRLTR